MQKGIFKFKFTSLSSQLIKIIIEILIHQCKVILLKEKVGAYPSFLHPLYAKSREVGAFWSSWTCSAINASAIYPQCHLYHHMRHHHHCSFSWLPDLPISKCSTIILFTIPLSPSFALTLDLKRSWHRVHDNTNSSPQLLL